MSSSVLEIIELSNGEVVLQRADGRGGPILSIKFSEEVKTLVGDNQLEIVQAMIDAGMHIVSQQNGIELEGEWDLVLNTQNRILH